MMNLLEKIRMNTLTVLSHFQAKSLLRAKEQDAPTVTISTDLNRSVTQVEINTAGVHFPNGEALTWDQVAQINEAKNNCFLVCDHAITKIQAFSDAYNRLYSLMPTAGAPTFLISGIPMHRIKDIDPHEDTLQKLHAVKPVVGSVLDTATGLGYTAIAAARTAAAVITIELDPQVLEIARCNPWSQELFHHPRITQLIGDSFEQVNGFAENTFSLVIHDPPMFSLAGELYSTAFYRELWRVLKPRGRLFHYIGDLDSSSGSRVARGAVRRLKEAGFARTVDRPAAFGLVAFKT